MRRERRAANVERMKRANRNVEIQIDELVLHGFPIVDRYAIGDALSYELSRLAIDTQEYPFDKDIDIPVQRAGGFSVPPNAKPALIGAKVAQTVHAGLNTMNNGGRS
jgi:hypothetical protein